jgi:hypothetical protein
VIIFLRLRVREVLVLLLLLVLTGEGSGTRSRTPSLLSGELFAGSLATTRLAGGLLGPSHTQQERGSLGANDLHPYEIKDAKIDIERSKNCSKIMSRSKLTEATKQKRTHFARAQAAQGTQFFTKG